jgi:hypothetical protein
MLSTTLRRWLHSASSNARGPGDRPRSARRPCFAPCLLVLEDRTLPSTLTVLTNADSGDGSLRAAVVAARRRRPENNCPCGCVGPGQVVPGGPRRCRARQQRRK